MMPDREQGIPITRGTSCRVGSHTFLWATASTAVVSEPEGSTRCTCGLYFWDEWQTKCRTTAGRACQEHTQ